MSEAKDKIGIIAHVDHGKTILTAAIINALNKTEKKTKTIHEIIKEERTMKITASKVKKILIKVTNIKL